MASDFEMVGFSVGVLVTTLAYVRWRRRVSARPQFICTKCGSTGKPASSIGFGALVFALVGWIPALLFGGWSASKPKKCGTCKERSMIPTSTPVGQKLLRDQFPPST